MIANGLLLQTEFPPLLDDIKRALLTYDHVYLYAPDDRDIMPSELYNAAAFGLPMGFGGVPVRPLGKVIDYDDAFQRTVEQCEAAFDQGCLSILPCAAPHVDPTMQGARLVLGTPPTPPNQPNPQRLLGYYRALATLSSMVTGIGRSLDALPLLTDANVERIAPKGIDDQKVTFEVVGATQKTSLPAVALYEGFAHTDDERVVLTRICLARLAALVRALAHCEMLGLQPYTTDVGYSSVLQQLSANARDAIVEATQDQEADIDAVAARLLSRLHNLVMSEFIDQEAVHAMSVSEVLKLRSKSWGTAGEQREAMMRSLWLLSRNAKNSEDFDQACRTTLEEYRRARSDRKSTRLN